MTLYRVNYAPNQKGGQNGLIKGSILTKKVKNGPLLVSFDP